MSSIVVFALAEYLVHEVYDTGLVMLLDSLEGPDADQIAALAEHVAKHANSLVVAPQLKMLPLSVILLSYRRFLNFGYRYYPITTVRT